MSSGEIGKAIRNKEDIKFIIDGDKVIAELENKSITLDSPARTLRYLLGELGIEVEIK